jgi:hypothetical protein
LVAHIEGGTSQVESVGEWSLEIDIFAYEVTGDWRKLQSQEHCYQYISPNISVD